MRWRSGMKTVCPWSSACSWSISLNPRIWTTEVRRSCRMRARLSFHAACSGPACGLEAAMHPRGILGEIIWFLLFAPRVELGKQPRRLEWVYFSIRMLEFRELKLPYSLDHWV